MIDENDIPDSLMERASVLEGLLISRATGGIADNHIYELLRREFMGDGALKNLLPTFVRTHRNLDAFWPFIKHEASTYAGRRQIISDAFTPLIDQLEGLNSAPGDPDVSTTLKTFDADGVHAVWTKALDRRVSDPEGAITVARTLLETVAKRILDEMGEIYNDQDDLPKLYAKAAKTLNLAPNQHTAEPIKAILGSAMNLVNGIGTLRNRMSDSHGRGGRLPVRPSPRHASLAVNTAGAITTFLIETYLETQIKVLILLDLTSGTALAKIFTSFSIEISGNFSMI